MALSDKLLDVWRDSGAANYARRVDDLVSPYYRQLRARYYKLEKRERMLVRIAAAVIGAFIVYNLIYLPIVSYQAGLADEISARQRDLTDVRRMAVTWRQVRKELSGLEKNTALTATDFSLPATLSNALNGVVGNDKIGGINPLPNKPVSDQFTQYGADLKLSGVSLQELVDVLYKIKSIKEPVVVSNVTIRKHPADAHSYDVEMTCSVLGKNA
jgi:type II secretory pathway component PulM